MSTTIEKCEKHDYSGQSMIDQAKITDHGQIPVVSWEIDQTRKNPHSKVVDITIENRDEKDVLHRGQ